MNLLGKNLIIFYLLISVLGIFSFHWFFVGNMMPAGECLSTDCVYSSIQMIIPPETMNILLIALLAILLIAFLPLTKLLADNFKKIPGRMFLKWKIDGVFRKLLSWLKILEKRDSQAAECPLGLAAWIFDFRQ